MDGSDWCPAIRCSPATRSDGKKVIFKTVDYPPKQATVN